MNRQLPRPSDVLYEDNHLLAINKPAGLPTMGVEAGESSVVTWARDYLKEKYHKPGNVYVGVVSRLDAMVSGVVILARTSKAASRLTTQFHDRGVEKIYWAWVSADIRPDAAQWVDSVCKDEPRRRMMICPAAHRDAKEARLRYEVLARTGPGALVRVELETGRKHQIRVQFAERGFPVWGDSKYGSQHPFPRGIALHARDLVIEHPVRKEPIAITAPLPTYWPRSSAVAG